MATDAPLAILVQAAVEMGNWENTTYVRHDDIEKVANVIVGLFAGEGMQRIARPAPRTPKRFDPMQYATALENNLWGLALFPGSPGWTVIKTAPLEVLGERAQGAGGMRLGDLAECLRTAACQVNLFDGTSLVLVEADCDGTCRISGYCVRSDNPDPLRFNGEDIAGDRIEVRFDLLPLQSLVDACTRQGGAGMWLDDNELVSRLAQTLAGDRAAACDNLTSVHFLLSQLPLEIAGGIDLYFEWPARDRHSPRLEALARARPELFV